MITRKDIAAQLVETARLLEVLGEDEFRARGFHVAARAFESFDGDVTALYIEDRFTDLRGVGKGTAAELRAMFEEGVLPTLAQLRERVPDEVKEMFAVSGLGAKRIGTLWRSGVTGVDGLVRAAEEGRLAALPGFGAKSAANLLASARFAQAARSRMRLDEADRLAEAILSALASEYPWVRAQAAGEYRRALETVSGLEIVVSGLPREELTRLAGRLLDEVDEDSSTSGVLMGRRIEFRLVEEERFGSALLLATGSDAFLAGLLEHSNGLPAAPEPLEGERGLADSEEEIFERLGLSAVPPELREEWNPRWRSEGPPSLVELSEIRGVVHNHSTWSDGALSMREMVSIARDLGYDYLAMADHSRSSTVANGLTPERVVAQAAEVRAIRDELELEGSDFELLHGIEVDILPDGTLDLPDDLLATLDYSVASVHQNFGLSSKDQTARIVRAVHNPHVSILAHPTGRLLLRRPGYELDLEAVIQACVETGTVIEINANPRRLDLDWRWVIRARELGCRFSINPDAHTGDGFDDLRYGVLMARKAGLTREDVVNTASTGEEFLARLRTRR